MVKPAPYFRKVEVTPPALPATSEKFDWKSITETYTKPLAKTTVFEACDRAFTIGLFSGVGIGIFTNSRYFIDYFMLSLICMCIAFVIIFVMRSSKQKSTPTQNAPKQQLIEHFDINAIEGLLRKGSEIEALKTYRTMTGEGLKEAQAAIEKLKANLST